MADSKALRITIKTLISIPIFAFGGMMDQTLGQSGDKTAIMIVNFVILGVLWGVWAYKPKASDSRDITRR
jgi:hypothetical protein